MRNLVLVVALASIAAVPGAARPAASKPLLNVAPDGISLVDPASGRSRNLTFGTPRATVVAAATRALGKSRSVGNNAECGAGPIAFVGYSGGLTLNFRDGRFAGWSLRKGAPRITNAAGIGIGSTRAALASAMSVKVMQSSLGAEFAAGDLSGLLGGKTRTARITDMWAGATCIAR